ncbi:MAG TPA: hypothetical protein VN408_26750 [Actinoplanes sp.]|nr:hypothetical protein [Actinoplanes sp.]
MIPSTIRGLVQTRRQLTGMLRAFRLHGPRGLFAFGRHHRAEAVILAWPLYEQLSAAAHALEDASHAVELDRRRRNPRGPDEIALTGVVELLGVTAPAAARSRKAGPPARRFTAWPTALDDLMRLGEQQAQSARTAIGAVLTDVAHGRQAGTAMVSQPGQPSLDGYRRVVVPLGPDGGSAVIVFGDPGDTSEPVELLGVLTAGALVGALQELEDFADLDTPGDEDDEADMTGRARARRRISPA